MQLKKIREERHFSQKEISVVLCVRQNTYSQYETGTRQIPIEALIKLSVFYHVCVDYLLGLTDVEEPYPTSLCLVGEDVPTVGEMCVHA